MVSKTTEIVNETGLHARPAATFVQAAAKFHSNVMIKKVGTDMEADAKKIMRVLTIGLCQGDKIEISAEGDDEEEAVNELSALIDSGFGE